MATPLQNQASATDLISFLKALPYCRMRRVVRLPQWWMRLVAILTILSKRERKRGRDLTWILRGMPVPPWVVENWPGSATILTVRCEGVASASKGETIDVNAVGRRP